MVTLGKYSMGIGDRFGCQGRAQLQALLEGRERGREVVPVWNKSHREHTIIGTRPEDVRREADGAVAELGYEGGYHVDADHIGLGNVELFLAASDFFTLDVADFTGEKASEEDIEGFLARYSWLCGDLELPVLGERIAVTAEIARASAEKYLLAVRKAGEIYRRIEAGKGAGSFVTEVSMDETDSPQTPVEMLFILAAVADEGIPAQTIAPKFSGRFNKGVDYVGDCGTFAREFEQDLAIVRFAVERFSLPGNLKLSVHSGSDKFSIYGCMRAALERFGAGLHLKTAGTTWLEELIGLASAGGDALELAREVYREAVGRYDELCGPYAPVIDIDRGRLPAVGEVDGWSGAEFAAALRHDPDCPAYNPHFRQLLHVAYKVAAEMGDRYLAALRQNAGVVGENVRQNLLDRHLVRVFPGTP
jgi:hypothetical protein